LRKAIPIGGGGLVAGGVAGVIGVLGSAVAGVVVVGALATTTADVDIASRSVLRGAVAVIEPVAIAPRSIVADAADAVDVTKLDGDPSPVADRLRAPASGLPGAVTNVDLLDPSVPLDTLAPPPAQVVVEDVASVPAVPTRRSPTWRFRDRPPLRSPSRQCRCRA